MKKCLKLIGMSAMLVILSAFNSSSLIMCNFQLKMSVRKFFKKYQIHLHANVKTGHEVLWQEKKENLRRNDGNYTTPPPEHLGF